MQELAEFRRLNEQHAQKRKEINSKFQEEHTGIMLTTERML